MAAVEFALVGHQDDWSKISKIFHSLREPRRGRVDLETLRELVGWIPPRPLAGITYRSLPSGKSVTGVYIDTFITPDALAGETTAGTFAKVRAGIQCAANEGARVVALGGFTSIFVEAQRPSAHPSNGPALTTGNTLAAALIVQGVKRAALLLGHDLANSTILVIGATGDIGSACSRHLGPRCRKLLLTARNAARLRSQVENAVADGIDAEADVTISALLPRADIVVSVASLAAPGVTLDTCRPGVIVCDAGYPHNIKIGGGEPGAPRVFWGGMGHVAGGWTSDSTLFEDVYSFPIPSVFHGCLLEAVLLAFESRYVPFSQGRGFITNDRIDEIAAIAVRHGVTLAPLFNQHGVWPEEVPFAEGAA
jgi:fatty aldehyde-generating acyl-ACP reductase